MQGDPHFARPATLAAAFELLEKPGWHLLAGGTDVYPAMTREAGPAGNRHWLDLSAIDELGGMTSDASGTRIAAGTDWATVRDASLPAPLRALRQAAGQIGGRQIQNTATLCGNIANASPAADGAPPLLALDACIEIASSRGRRMLPLDAFLLGNRQTALVPGELVTAILLPPLPATSRSVFLKLGSRSHLVISICSVAVWMDVDPEGGKVGRCHIAVGACAPTAKRLPALEGQLEGMASVALEDVRIGPGDLGPLSPIDDIRATAGYRLEATARLIEEALSILAREFRS